MTLRELLEELAADGAINSAKREVGPPDARSKIVEFTVPPDKEILFTHEGVDRFLPTGKLTQTTIWFFGDGDPVGVKYTDEIMPFIV